MSPLVDGLKGEEVLSDVRMDTPVLNTPDPDIAGGDVACSVLVPESAENGIRATGSCVRPDLVRSRPRCL
jgi:hypothetical protein